MRATPLLLMLCILLGPSVVVAEPPCSPFFLSAITIREETLGFQVDVEYPVLCTPQSRRTIRDWVGFRLFDFKKIDPEHDLSDFPHKYWLQMRYAIWPSPIERFASVKLNVSVYTGGAHSNHWPMTWIFDRQTDQPIGLEDLFADLEEALPAISDLCRPVLRQSLGAMYSADMLEDGIIPMEHNFTSFILTADGVVFFFAPYQVGPFAAGEQVVTIPYFHLKTYFTPQMKEALKRPSTIAPSSKKR